MQPTKQDMLLVGNYIKTQSLERTARGVDADGHPFTGYSTKGPYYYNPNGREGSSFTKVARRQGKSEEDIGIVVDFMNSRGAGQKAAAKRFLNKVTTKEERKQPGAPQLSRSGRSIKFESYDAFKKTMGRANVDLTGPRAPHMLQGVQVRVSDDGRGVIIGVYGEAGARAKGHQYGIPGRLPQRKFLGATPADRAYCLKLLSAQVRGRFTTAGKL